MDLFEFQNPLLDKVSFLEQLLEGFGVEVDTCPINVESDLLGSFSHLFSELLKVLANPIPHGLILNLRQHRFIPSKSLCHLIELLGQSVLQKQNVSHQLVHFL